MYIFLIRYIYNNINSNSDIYKNKYREKTNLNTQVMRQECLA